jgi:hypothetical protein
VSASASAGASAGAGAGAGAGGDGEGGGSHPCYAHYSPCSLLPALTYVIKTLLLPANVVIGGLCSCGPLTNQIRPRPVPTSANARENLVRNDRAKHMSFRIDETNNLRRYLFVFVPDEFSNLHLV